MITPACAHDPFQRERIVVVATASSAPGLTNTIERWHPSWSIVTYDAPVAAIADVAEQPPRGVLLWVDPSNGRMAEVTAALRESAGDDTPIVLCCQPQHEPFSAQLVASGADDYVVHPMHRDDWRRALRIPTPEDVRPEHHTIRTTSAEDIARIAELLGAIDGRPSTLIHKLAAAAHALLPATGISLVVEGSIARSGADVSAPVLQAALTRNGVPIGQLLVGPPAGEPYSDDDTRLVHRVADLISVVLATASAQRSLHALAMTDECTGLPNRRYFLQRFDEILAEAQATRFPVTVLLFDVDNFKQFNDAYGHSVGDEVLRTTGELFRQNCRAQDVVARFGGDEFAVVFWDAKGPRVPGSKHPDCALSVLERVRQAMSDQRIPNKSTEATGRLTISGGLATYPWNAATRDLLLKNADEALLAAKRAGRNRVFLIGQVE